MSQTARWWLAAVSATAFVVFAFLQGADLVANSGGGEALTNDGVAKVLQVFGALGVLVAINVAAIPSAQSDRRPYVQEWAKPKDD